MAATAARPAASSAVAMSRRSKRSASQPTSSCSAMVPIEKAVSWRKARSTSMPVSTA
jgi:hypothetical protein